MKLTPLQSSLLEALDRAMGAPLLCGEMGSQSIHVARSLEKRGMVNVETDELGYRYVSWDGEAHADWVREKEQEHLDAMNNS
ncbi:MAG: hypothetical protein RPU42_14495 [Candidatus Sedimenticola sp. (ex Thyasira tokunagai)]